MRKWLERKGSQIASRLSSEVEPLGDCLDEIIQRGVTCTKQIPGKTVKRTMKDQRDVFTTFG